MLKRLALLLLPAIITFTVFSCKHEPPVPGPAADTVTGNYPPAVAKIIVNKCATAGCHNAASYSGAGGLRLDTWEHMFEGGNNGASVVAYSVDYSPLLYFINTDSSLGPVAEPRMPKDMAPLTTEEYNTMKNWIANGAPSKNGDIPFGADAATRQKIYLTQQGCDMMAVVDGKTKLVMRYIPLGVVPGTPEVPHCVRFTHDGRFAFTSFTSGTTLQKIDATTDQVVQNIDLGRGSWNIVLPNKDGTKVAVSDVGGNKFIFIDSDGLRYEVPELPGAHGVAANDSFNVFYVSGQAGNIIYKTRPTDLFAPVVKVSLNGKAPARDSSLDPHELMMAPDFTKYFVTCQRTNEVRVMSTITDKPLDSIPVGVYPQEMAISTTKPYIFITCQEDPSPFSTPLVRFKGSVYVVNYITHQVVKKIEGRFMQPHGITVDDKNGFFYFASRNLDPYGPAPHHTSSCSGKNGYYNVYDLNTLEPTSRRYEVIPDPYSFDSRFK